MVKYPPSFRQMVGGMYHIFLLRQGKIAGHHKFSAENDAWACRAAALAFDACCDYCDDFELWYGVRLLASHAGWKTREVAATQARAPAGAQSATLDRAIEGIAARILEGAMQTSDVLRDSLRFNSRLSALRRPSAEPRD
jgi:hypothetical protein